MSLRYAVQLQQIDVEVAPRAWQPFTLSYRCPIGLGPPSSAPAPATSSGPLGAFQATTIGLTMPQPTNAGITPSIGGSVKSALQPLNSPITPSRINTIPSANPDVHRDRSCRICSRLSPYSHVGIQGAPPSIVAQQCRSLSMRLLSGVGNFSFSLYHRGCCFDYACYIRKVRRYYDRVAGLC